MKELEDAATIGATPGPKQMLMDPPSRYELDASGSRAAALARARARDNVPVRGADDDSMTSSALNLIQETLDGDEELAKKRASYMASFQQNFTGALRAVDQIRARSNADSSQHMLNNNPSPLQDKTSLSIQKSPADPPVTPKTGTLESVLAGLRRGYNVHAYLSPTSQHPEQCLLHLDENKKYLCISNTSRPGDVNQDSVRTIKIPMANVFKLEFGRDGPSGARLNPLTSFSVAIERGGVFTYLDFEAGSPNEREILVSSLMAVLEALYKDSTTAENETREKLENRSEHDSLGMAIYDENDLEDHGTSEQPIPCSPSLENDHTDSFVQPRYGHPETFTFDNIETREGQDHLYGGGELGTSENHPIVTEHVEPSQGYYSTEAAVAIGALPTRGVNVDGREGMSLPKESEGEFASVPSSYSGMSARRGFMDVASGYASPRGNGIPPKPTPDGFHKQSSRSQFNRQMAQLPEDRVIAEAQSSLSFQSVTASRSLRKDSDIEQTESGRMYPMSESFSENSTVAFSNVRDKPTARSTINVVPETIHKSGTLTKPIVIEEEQAQGTAREERDPQPDTDDNQSIGTQDTKDTNFGVQTESNFMSFINSRSRLSLGTRSGPNSLEMGWCSDDVCTTTLNDMAQSCSGMFGAKQIGQGACSVEPNCIGQESCSTDQNCMDPATQVACTPAAPTCMDPKMTEEQLAVVEEYVKNALGAPSAMYAFFVEDPVVEASPVEQKKNVKNEIEVQGNHKRKNRASMRNAQAGRMRDLRKEMTFASALKQSQEHMRTINTTQSFNDAQPRRAITNQAANQFLGSDLLSSVVHTMGQGSGNQIEGNGDDVAYYDSDPEDSREQTLDRGPRRVSADLQNVRKGESGKAKPPGLGKIRKKLSRRVDEEVVKDIVQVMQNDRLTLMWHPTQTRREANKPPTLVRLWIESGLQLIDGSFLLPKLTWTRASEETGFRTGSLHKLDLLDICRIRPIAKIDREKHPFANKNVSFIIETQADMYMFEAETAEERDRVVYGLKVVVARLASLLMLRDYRAAEEFFGNPHQDNNVPGSAPI